ncbi:MAG: hypothetical protein KGO48_13930 [Alphaproteobacteria bacterium]|nr:hypothetical protein [Alphaproteobacteria bacterium]
MADVADVHDMREVREVPVRVRRRHTSPGALFLMFVLGVVCAVAVGLAALSILDIHGTISWPAGRIDLGQHSVIAIHHDAT